MATQASAASNRLRIEFVFDVASPHSALAWRVLSNYTSTWHSRATISAVPVCMKTMMKVAGTSAGVFDDVAVRKALAILDAVRIADQLSLPLKVSAMTLSTEPCQRLLTAARLDCAVGTGLVTSLTSVLFRRHWMLDTDIGSDSALLAAAVEAGMSDKLAHKCVEESHTDAVTVELAATTSRAIRCGMFSIPAMFVSQETREAMPLFPMYGVADKSMEQPSKGVCWGKG